jgi:CPSF A subunit region
VYDLTHDNLSEIAIFGAPISALTLSIRPPFILLGDLMSSILLLRLDTSTPKPELVTVSRDYSPLWMTSVAILDETWFLGAEDSGNLVGWRRDDDTGADEVRLGMVQEVRVGEMVNRVRLGEMGGGEVEGVECRALFCTTEGTIGIFAALEEGRFVMLDKLERKMEEIDVALGGLDHAR